MSPPLMCAGALAAEVVEAGVHLTGLGPGHSDSGGNVARPLCRGYVGV
jgi:hypothetical protein